MSLGSSHWMRRRIWKLFSLESSPGFDHSVWCPDFLHTAHTCVATGATHSGRHISMFPTLLKYEDLSVTRICVPSGSPNQVWRTAYSSPVSESSTSKSIFGS